MKGRDKKDIAVKIIAAVCAVIIVLTAGTVILSGMGSTELETITYAEPSPSPSEEAEADEVFSDDALVEIAVPLDDTG
ncbi:MAG: hypothetical protein IJD14_04785, partial [Christensenellaceae bacterium]|nr:hypothetical protein [Christensenellaceae bacterium]